MDSKVQFFQWCGTAGMCYIFINCDNCLHHTLRHKRRIEMNGTRHPGVQTYKKVILSFLTKTQHGWHAAHNGLCSVWSWFFPVCRWVSGLLFLALVILSWVLKTLGEGWKVVLLIISSSFLYWDCFIEGMLRCCDG